MSTQPPWVDDERPPWEIDDAGYERENPLVGLRESLVAPAQREAQRRSIVAPAVAGAQGRGAEVRDPLVSAREASRKLMTDPSAAEAGFLGEGGPETASGVLGAAALMTGGPAALRAGVPGVAKFGWEMAKSAVPYYAAKTAGLPEPLAIALGGVSPAKSALKALRGGGTMSKEAMALAERRVALAEKKFAAKQAMDAAKAAQKASASSGIPVEVKAAQTAAEVGKTVPKAAPKASALSIEEEQQLISMARFLRRTNPRERAALNEWLKQQPPEIAERLRTMLARGVDTPRTRF